MIGFVCGIKGTGKTKRMVDMANAIVQDALGKVVFIDATKERMFDLKHAIRLVEADEYMLENHEAFFGFIAGLIAGDFDIHTIFIERFLKIVDAPVDTLIPLLKRLEELADSHNVRLIISISGPLEEMPAYIKEKVQ